jgi:hypothetical protein
LHQHAPTEAALIVELVQDNTTDAEPTAEEEETAEQAELI